MKPNTKLLFYLFIGLFLFSCDKNNESVALLKSAQENFETNPDRVLALLDSIENPEKMDKEDYMHYIVAYTRAKSEAGKDISGDTLIFEARRFFHIKGNSGESALANYYTGQVCYANKLLPEALEFYLFSANEAKKANNNLLEIKSYNNIGYVYYERNMIDSAIVNYKRALSINRNIENSDKNTPLTSLIFITANTNIARAYEERNPDSAYFYYNRVLDKAIETNNEKYQSISLQNLGIVCYKKKEFEKAIEYFQSALALKATDKEQTRNIGINMLRIYNAKQDPNSARQYAELVEASLTEVTYNYTLKEMYAALSDYYNNKGDYEKALEYSKLEKLTIEKIEQEKNIPTLMEADKNFNLTNKEREAQELRVIVLWIVLGVVIFLVVVLLFVIYERRDTKKFKQEIERQTEKYDIALGQLRAENEKYLHIDAEIKAMMEDANKEEEGEK